MAFTTFTSGTKAKASEVNANFLPTKIVKIYTGTGFDTTGASASTTQSITSAELNGATYLIVEVHGSSYCGRVTNGSTSASLLVERSETGVGSWSTVYTGSTAATSWNSGIPTSGSNGGGVLSLKMIITLTAGELSSGIDIKFTGSVGTTGGISNRQTVFYISY